MLSQGIHRYHRPMDSSPRRELDPRWFRACERLEFSGFPQSVSGTATVLPVQSALVRYSRLTRPYSLAAIRPGQPARAASGLAQR
jgi:hypothetical protein